MSTTNTQHTPGPLGSQTWKVIGHPLLKDRHAFHENRYVVSSDAVVEIYDHNPDVRNAVDWDSAWGLRNGVIICELRDSSYQKRYADLIAAAPELLEALKEIIRVEEAAIKRFADQFGQESCDQVHPKPLVWEAQARAAIAKAEGRA